MKEEITIPIKPMPYVRIDNKYNFRGSKRAGQYIKYKEDLQVIMRAKKYVPSDRLDMEFHVPMPKSWSLKKKKEMLLRPHAQRPDLDNYVKAVLDSFFYKQTGGDAGVHEIRARKVWSNNGCIHIKNINN